MEIESRLQKRLRRNYWFLKLILPAIIPIIIIYFWIDYIENEKLQGLAYILVTLALVYCTVLLYYVQYQAIAIKTKEKLLFLKIKNIDFKYGFPQNFISNLSEGALEGENVDELICLNESLDKLNEEELQIALVNIKMFNNHLKYFSSGIFALSGILAGLFSLVTLNYIVNYIFVVLVLVTFVISVIGINITFYIKQRNLYFVIQNLIENNIEKQEKEAKDDVLMNQKEIQRLLEISKSQK
ncbi:hypothetical protein [Oceanobacillus neutriphilus]|uniref:Uncharacterized protein n=1 Tax=Oceanobacillus neutriphilus TaxID=531815 RepID=A0ABQ2NV83_9BACI|nr:hypothetical protein [Oceanobacillus neutriphilus]GGP11190.1 hypothetical protein GCM10011346_22370 [Oceanobacillus neutriphilus]